MRALIACEFSGTVRRSFEFFGHEAMSCDLLPTEDPGWHYQGNVLDVLGDGWDLMIAHPPMHAPGSKRKPLVQGQDERAGRGFGFCSDVDECADTENCD